MQGKRKVSEAHMRATAKWEATNYDKVLVRFPKDTNAVDRIKATGASLNGFIIKATLAMLNAVEHEKEP